MNKTSTTIAAILFSIVAFIGLSVFSLAGYGISTYNTAKNLQITYEAKADANKADFDNVIKVISQTAQVSRSQLDKLQQIYTSYADARTNDSANSIMNWVQESVPNVDTTTMNNLQNIIVSSRNTWTERQKELVDISREYNTKLVVFPNNLILGLFGFKQIDPTIITSDLTDRAFETGKDNSTKLEF